MENIKGWNTRKDIDSEIKKLITPPNEENSPEKITSLMNPRINIYLSQTLSQHYPNTKSNKIQVWETTGLYS